MKGTGFGVAAIAGLALSGCATAQAPANYHVATRIALSDGGWDYASVDPAARRLYLARTDAVTAVDLDTKTVIAKLAAAARGHEALPLKGDELLVTNGTPGTAVFLNAKTGSELATVP